MKKDYIILGIETSCDETAVAIVKNGREVLTNTIASQIDVHEQFGGVVPEVASRKHVEQITIVIEAAIKKANVSWDDIDAIAVTEGPGLVGALLIGISAAKAIAFAKNKPLIAVNHIVGHIYANRIESEFEFPLLSLIVSGGHTELILMEDYDSYQLIGETLDDAAGEAYDKVARILELPYPGGPHIDRLALEGVPSIDFPRAWLEKDSFNFSFSGLKSAVNNFVHNSKQRGEKVDISTVSASFQESVVEVLTEKTFNAAMEYNIRQLIVAGGVAANKGLRKSLNNRFKPTGIPVLMPPFELCTDNAVMIAAAASIKYEKEQFASWRLNAKPSLTLT